jgi:ABC-type dipeptide/oligopeptide/nickel transport system permease subunit
MAILVGLLVAIPVGIISAATQDTRTDYLSRGTAIAMLAIPGFWLGTLAITLGYGVPPPYPAWGAMLSGTGRAYMLQSPWLSIWPGLAISLAVFGFNVLGDALRDVLDPRLRGAR